MQSSTSYGDNQQRTIPYLPAFIHFTNLFPFSTLTDSLPFTDLSCLNHLLSPYTHNNTLDTSYANGIII